MNDRQLIDALRTIGTRPAEPDGAFRQELWERLSASHVQRRVRIRRDLLLAAAMLVLLGLAIVLAIGARLLQDRPLVVEATPPAVATIRPEATDDFPFTVQIPDGVEPISDVAEVEAAALALSDPEFGLDGGAQRIAEMIVIAPGMAFPDMADGWTSRPDPVWGIDLRNRDDFQVLVYLVDGTLEVAGVDPPDGEPGPEATIEVLPTWDPAESIELVRAGGGTILPEQVPVFEPGLPWALGRPVANGDILWMLANPTYTDDPPHLVRVDTKTGDRIRVDAPEDVRFGTLVGGLDSLWLAGDVVYELDPISGEVRETTPAVAEGSLLAEDDDGLWWRIVGGAVLTDPESGDELARFMSDEADGQAYTGIWQPPAFGSLWDLERTLGRVRRFDAQTGNEQADIAIGDPVPTLCNDPEALVGVDGLPPMITVNCTSEVYFIDPASNTVSRSLHIEGYTFAAEGGLWAVSVPGMSAITWWAPGTIFRIDPITGATLDVLSLSRDRTWAHSPVIVRDSLWMMVGEQARPNQGHDHNLTLIGIPLAELTP
jgi:hypothetical protein